MVTTVTKRIRQITQPYGGYLPLKAFTQKALNDGNVLAAQENIHGIIIGLAIDYMTRFLTGTPKEEAFDISLKGIAIAASRDEKVLKEAERYFYLIEGNDKVSIVNACKLVIFDVWCRNPIGASGAKTAKDTNPDDDTVRNISIMLQRSVDFFNKYGIIRSGFTFEGGYTSKVSAGDGDFLTKDTLWDLKVIKDKPSSKHTLQLLMYWIMGIHSVYPEFKNIKKLGFYNPRSNVVLTCDLSKVSDAVIKTVEDEVICY